MARYLAFYNQYKLRPSLDREIPDEFYYENLYKRAKRGLGNKRQGFTYETRNSVQTNGATSDTFRMKPSKSQNKVMQTRQRAIDILRGVAILAVVFHHLAGNNGAPVYPAGWWWDYGLQYAFGTWLSHGWLGVNLFFILSGYVLFLPYAQVRRQFSSHRDVLSFYVHRSRRLLPLYFISTFVALFILGNYWPQYNLTRAFAMATLTFNFIPELFAPPGNVALWSLGIEIWYSIIFPCLALMMVRYRPSMVYLGIVCLAYITRVVGTALDSRMIWGGLLAHLDDFVLGMLVAHSWAAGEKWTNWSGTKPAFVTSAGITVMTMVAWGYDVESVNHISPWMKSTFPLVFQFGAGMLLVGMLALGNRPNAFSWGTAWILEMLGMMCYSIYIWHVLFIGGLHPNVIHPLQVPVFILILLVFSWLSYRYIEFGHVRNVNDLLPSR